MRCSSISLAVSSTFAHSLAIGKDAKQGKAERAAARHNKTAGPPKNSYFNIFLLVNTDLLTTDNVVLLVNIDLLTTFKLFEKENFAKILIK